MPIAICPDDEQLFDYVVGRLTDEHSQSVAEHLDACSECQAKVVTLDDADDTLVGGLRGAGAEDPFVDESQCAEAVARARSLAGRSLPDLPLGQTLGEYRLLEVLGRGGMGTVYKALHTKLDRVVALKVLPGGRLADERAIARFEREMKAIGRLEHPNIVHAHDAREIDGRPVLVMAHVDGLDLSQVVRRCGKLPVPDACELARQTATGLQYAHENGLVHRDIKPSNLMLTSDGQLKMLDLGLARLHLDRPAGKEMTGTGQAMGTADYMAPEQTSDSRTVDIRADIYSLGCTLYKLLSGRAPFGGSQYPGAFEKMTAHVNDPVPPIRDVTPEVPEALAALLDRMLAKTPEDRFATPTEVADALQPFCVDYDLEGLAIRAQETPPEGSDEFSAREIPNRPAVPVPQPAGRWRKLVGVAVALLLVGSFGFAMGIIITITRDDKTTTVEVPDGAEVKIDEEGQVGVTLHGEGGTSKPPPADAGADLKAIEGTWQVTSVLQGGIPWPEDMVRGNTFRFSGNRLEMSSSEDKYSVQFMYGIDPTKNPSTIDWMSLIGEGTMPTPGIYRLEGDELTICVSNIDRDGRPMESSGRPTEFVSRVGWVDQLGWVDDMLWILKRTAERQPREEPGHDVSAASDFQAIQGTWQLVSCSNDPRMMQVFSYRVEPGEDPPGELEVSQEFCKTTQIVITSDALKLYGPYTIDKTYKYQINPAASPKMIDVMLAMAGLGVYELRGDQLKICLNWSASSDGKISRPSVVWADMGSGHELLVLRRVGPAAVEPDEEDIQGVWNLVDAKGEIEADPFPGMAGAASEIRRMAIPEGSVLKGKEVVIDRHQITFKAIPTKHYGAVVGVPLTTSPQDQSHPYALTPSAQPRQINLFFVFGRSCLGIYELQDNRLRIYLGKERPKQMADEPGENEALLVLERVGEKAVRQTVQPVTIIVDVDRHGTIFVDGEKHDLPSLEKRLREVPPSKKLNVRLRCARELPWNRAVELIDLMRMVGVHEYSLTVADPTIRLDFRIAATRGGLAKPVLRKEEIERYLEALVTGGPRAGGKNEEPFAWFELVDDTLPGLMVTATYEDRQYVLLATTPNDVMLASEDGKRTWYLTAVDLGRDQRGHRVLEVELDKAGGKRFEALTGSHLMQPLAILLNDQVVSAPSIRSKIGRKVEITGSFSGEEAQKNIEALLAGMVARPAGREATTVTESKYDGKTLDQWFAELKTERNPERLAQAVRALGVLTNEESAEKVVRRVFRLMREHCCTVPDNSPEGTLLKASLQTLWQMPAQAVVPVMIEEINSGNNNSREFMIWMANRPVSGMGYNMQRVEEISAEMKSRANQILALVLALSRDESDSTRNWALKFAPHFCRCNDIDPAKIEGLIARFQQELPTHDAFKLLLVLDVLLKNAPDTEGFVDSLTYLLSNEVARNRYWAIQGLGQLGSRSAPAVPKLVSLLTKYLKPPPPSSDSLEYVPTVPRFRAEGTDLRIEIIQTLGKIGPAAKEALPVLREVVSTHAEELGEHAKKAIAEIEGKGDEK